MIQKGMFSRVIRFKRGDSEGWTQHWIRSGSRIKEIVESTWEGYWSKRALREKIKFAGHIRRHLDSLAGSVVNWRGLAWWRNRQELIRPGSKEFRHPGRISWRSWETEVEEVAKGPQNQEVLFRFFEFEKYPACCWGQLACVGELWKLTQP